MGRRIAVAAAAVIATAALLVPAPAGGARWDESGGAARPDRAAAAPGFDLWRGVWKSGLFYMTVKTFPGGQVRGVFGEEPADLSSAEVGWTGYDFRGELTSDGARVAGVVVAGAAGEIAAELSVGDGPGFRTILLTQFAYPGGPAVDVGTYRYVRPVGSTGDRSRLRLDRTWDVLRNGREVSGSARVGDVVRLVFDAEARGPRGLEASYVALIVAFNKKQLAGRVDVVARLSDDVRCTRGQSKTTVFFRCLLDGLGPPDTTASVVIDVRVPAALRKKLLKASWKLVRARTLVPGLTVEVDDPDGVVKIPILPAKPGSGGGGGAGDGGSGGGDDGGGGSQPPPLTPVTDELLKELVCREVTMGDEPLQLATFGGFNPDIQSGFACGYTTGIGASVGGIQAQYTRAPGGVDYCRDLDSDGYYQRTSHNVQVYVPPWFDNAAALRRQILTSLENAGIALPCPR